MSRHVAKSIPFFQRQSTPFPCSRNTNSHLNLWDWRPSALLCVLAVLICFAGRAGGQVNPGLPSFSAYDSHQADTINLQNLNIILNIPIMQKSGASPFSYGITQNYYVYAAGHDTQWEVGTTVNPFVGVANGFLSSAVRIFGAFASSIVQTTCPNNSSVKTSEYEGWYINFPDGTVRLLPSTDVSDTQGCINATFTDQVTDGSGYTLSVNLGVVQSIYSKSGVKVSGTSLTDSNGNSISVNTSTGVFTDTLGVTAMTAGTGTYAWTDVNGSPQVSITDTSMTLKSNFGCPGNPLEYDLPGARMPTGLSYPDGTTFNIAYEPTPGGSSGEYTGRLSQVTLRSGGTVQYQYSGGSNGINCTYGIPPTLKRITSDGTTTYTWALVGNYGNTTTVVDNGGNTTVYTFTGLRAAADPRVLTEVQRYQGSSTLLTTDVYCYNASSGQPGNCATAVVVALPVTEVDVYHTINGMSTSSRSQTTYDNYGNVLVSAQYDFGATTPTYQTTTVYGSWNGSVCVAVSSTVNDKPCTVTTTQNGNTIAQSRFSYGSRGNLLTKYVWNGSAWLSNTTPNVYNPNGTPSYTYDLANNQTGYLYSSSSYTACGGCTNYPFPTSVSKGALTTYYTWNGTGGVLLTSSNPNASSTVTSYAYASCSGGTADPFWRVMSITDPLGNEVCKTYPSGSSPDTASSSFLFNSGNSVQNTTVRTDGYGRKINVQTQQGPSATKYDTVSSEYGWSGNYRTVTGTLPCSEPLSSLCQFSSGETAADIDPLGRSYKVTDGGGGTQTNTYTQNDVLSAVGPAPSGENTKQVQNQYDGLSRVTSSCKISSTVGGNVSCNQNTNTSATGVLTTTAYTSGTGYQTVTSTRGSQSRSKTLDGLGRVTQKVTPEGGTWNYYYDSAYGSCPSGYTGATGQLEAVVDPNGNKLCYAYDSLNRVTGVNANGTTCRHFYYDNSTGYSGTIPTGVTTPTNPYGRMVEAATDSCSSGTLITDEWLSYDKDGNKTDMWELTPHSTQYYHSTATFFGNGKANAVTLASPSLYTMTYGLDGEGRISTLRDTTANQSIVTGATYFPAANPAVVSLTGTDNDAYTYDVNTGRMTKFVFTVGSNNLTGNLSWNPNGTLGYLAVTDGFNSGGSETCYSNSSGSLGYGYDDLGRLVEFDCGSGKWGQQFAYDQFDNLTKTVLSGRTGTTWNPGYSSTANHCTGCTYDSNGDVTGDGNDVYGWSEFSKIMWTTTTGTPTCGTSGRCAIYDAFGRMVESSVSNTWKTYWYTQDGTMVMAGTTMTAGNWPVGSGIAETVGTTCCEYLHNDWLGNSRIVSSVNANTVTADQAYTPYGEIYNIFGANNAYYQVFANTIADLASSTTTPIMWDTPNRELSYAGRWLSPDPAGSGWNQYAYSTNPNSSVDPTGLQTAKAPLNNPSLGNPDPFNCYVGDGISMACTNTTTFALNYLGMIAQAAQAASGPGIAGQMVNSVGIRVQPFGCGDAAVVSACVTASQPSDEGQTTTIVWPNNPYVTAATDVAGLVSPFAGKTGKVLGYPISIVSVSNDRSPFNIVLNVAPFFVEDLGFPFAFIGAESDLLNFEVQTVGQGMIDAIPGNTIDDGNGYAMPNPAVMDICGGIVDPACR